jgi:HEAT repeat protein
MSTVDLARELRECARLAGTTFAARQTPHKLDDTPERRRVVARLKAIAVEFRARAAIPEIRALFEDDDLDVRAWAAGQLQSIDLEWGTAAFAGLCYRLGTREILALRRRALTRPPKNPLLADMSIDALVERFEDAATREYATRFVPAGNRPLTDELRNRIISGLVDIMREFKRHDALARLLPFLESDNITVRSKVARATITIAPERATKVLEAVITSGDPYELGAAHRALDNFCAGNSRVGGRLNAFLCGACGLSNLRKYQVLQ